MKELVIRPLPDTDEPKVQVKLNIHPDVENSLNLASVSFGLSKSQIVEQALLYYFQNSSS